MTSLSIVIAGVYFIILLVFLWLSWYFSRRVIEMRFQNDKSIVGVRIFWRVIGFILFFTLLLLILNNFILA